MAAVNLTSGILSCRSTHLTLWYDRNYEYQLSHTVHSNNT